MNKRSHYAMSAIAVLAAVGLVTPVHAVEIKWADWTAGSPGAGTATGEILTTTSTVTFDYAKTQGSYSFIQTGSGTDYFAQGPSGSLGRVPATSPYTSTAVDNIPTAAEMVALNQAGDQTLTFSETIANPYFAYVSLNGNGYAFDQDFEILSFGHPSDGNDCGYWGCGTSTKSVVDLGGGNFEYQLLGTGEPHGVLRFLGAFDTVSWRSLSNENWNGFTVGIEGTEQEILLGDITGVKFNDENGNGVRDAGELGLAGWIIELYDLAGNLLDTEITDATGSYEFIDLALGSYTVSEILQDGWIQTTGNGIYDIVAGQAIVVEFGNVFENGEPPPPPPPPPPGVPVPPTVLLLMLGVAGLLYQQQRGESSRT